MRRLLRGVLFLAVVWSITGAFLSLEIGLPLFLDEALKIGWIPEELAMPQMPPADAAAQCTDPVARKEGAATGPKVDPSILHQVRFITWRLGRGLGFAAAATNAISRPPEQILSLQHEIEALAGAINVPTPLPPKAQHLATALHEFEIYLEQDPECVAARLTSRYAPSFGHLYKFGAVIGHAVPFRANNIGAVFVPQIRQYGRLAGIPDSLWLSMTQDWRSLSQSEASERMSSVLMGLDQYLKETHP
jgi:hypothetical protein